MSTINRRTILAGAAILPAIAVPAAAQCAPDPVFAAIEAHKVAQAAWAAEIDKASVLHIDPPDSFGRVEADAARAMIKTIPTTLPGIAALVAYVHHCENTSCEIHNLNMRDNNEGGTGSIALLRTLDTALAALVRS